MSNHGRDEVFDPMKKPGLFKNPEPCLVNRGGNVIDVTQIGQSSNKPKEWWEKEKMEVTGYEPIDVPFINKAIEVGKLVGVKNRAYGNAFYDSGKILKILYKKGVSLEQMDDMLAVVRILDKIFRIASEKKALGESPYRDIAGYGILGDVREDSEEPEI